MGFRVNPEFDTFKTLQELGTGKALVSVIDEEGIPTIVKHTKICPPQSNMGTLDESERISKINNSVLFEKYNTPVDNDSAYEFLTRREAEVAETAIKEEEALNLTEKKKKEIEARKKATSKVARDAAKSTASTVGREVGKTIGNAIGGSFGKKVGGNLGASLGRGLIGTLFGGK